MKKILILTNHFQNSDGVCRSAINLANFLCTVADVEVTLRPLFKYEKEVEKMLDKRVILKPKFKFYIRGSKRILKLLPGKLLYKWFVKGNYDIEIGYCMILPQLAIAASTNKHAKHYGWTHGYGYLPQYRNLDCMVCVSKANVERMKIDLNNTIPVCCAHNLVDSDRIISNSNEQCELNKSDLFTFVSVARMSPEKGYDRLLKAMKKLFDSGYKFRLVLVGDGSETKTLKAIVNDCSLNEYVVFTGNQSNPHKYTKNADLFICTSTSEGYNTAMMESLIVGTPAISTDVPGAEEMISDSEVGFVMENSQEGIYEGIKKVLDNPKLITSWKNTLEKTKVRFFKSAKEKEVLDALHLN